MHQLHCSLIMSVCWCCWRCWNFRPTLIVFHEQVQSGYAAVNGYILQAINCFPFVIILKRNEKKRKNEIICYYISKIWMMTSEFHTKSHFHFHQVFMNLLLKMESHVNRITCAKRNEKRCFDVFVCAHTSQCFLAFPAFARGSCIIFCNNN